MGQRGLIYGRASRDPKLRGTSVDDQIRECRAWANANGVEVTHTIRDDNRPASQYASRQREGFEEVLQVIRDGSVDVLIVWEPSRAARDLQVFVSLRAVCRAAGVELSYKGRRYDLTQTNDSFTATLDALIAEREGSEIRDRNVRTVRRNAEAKRPHGRLPYGFSRVYDSSTGALIGQTPFVLADDSGVPVRNAAGDLVPVLPDAGSAMALSPEAQVVADAVRDVIAGKSLRKIAMDLNARGVPSPRKPRRKTLETDPSGVVTTWTPESLRQRLVNPTIAGRRVFQGKDIGQAEWPAIVDHGTWLTLHAVLTDPARRSLPVPRGREPRHLLSGIARCGDCERRLKARTNMSRLPRAYCCMHEGCRRVAVTAPRVDELVEAVLRHLFDTPGFRDDLAAAYREQSEHAEVDPDIPARIAALEAQRDELEALRARELISLRAYAAEDLRLDEQIEQLRDEQVAPVTSAALRRMFDAGTFAAGWDGADIYDRREIVRVLLAVSINRSTTRGRAFDYGRVVVGPSDFLLSSWDRLAAGDLHVDEPGDPDFVPGEEPPPMPASPSTVDEWAERALDAFPRPGPEVARQLLTLLPPDGDGGHGRPHGR